MTHFGSVDASRAISPSSPGVLDLWGQIALTHDQEGFAREIMAELDGRTPPN